MFTKLVAIVLLAAALGAGGPAQAAGVINQSAESWRVKLVSVARHNPGVAGHHFPAETQDLPAGASVEVLPEHFAAGHHREPICLSLMDFRGCVDCRLVYRLVALPEGQFEVTCEIVPDFGEEAKVPEVLSLLDGAFAVINGDQFYSDYELQVPGNGLHPINQEVDPVLPRCAKELNFP